jgi:6-phosphogluconolactonase
VLREVLFGERDTERLPSQLIRPRNGKLSFLLDEAAAAKLPREGAQKLDNVWTNTIEVER